MRKTVGKALSIAGILAAFAFTSPAAAQADVYPSREIKIVCAFPPGSCADVWVRFFAEQAKAFIKQPIIVDNRPGGRERLDCDDLHGAREARRLYDLHAFADINSLRINSCSRTSPSIPASLWSRWPRC